MGLTTIVSAPMMISGALRSFCKKRKVSFRREALRVLQKHFCDVMHVKRHQRQEAKLRNRDLRVLSVPSRPGEECNPDMLT